MKEISVHLFDFDRGELYKCLRKYVYANKPQFGDEKLSVFDMIKADFMIKSCDLGDRSDADFFAVFDKAVSVFSNRFKSDTVSEIASECFYTRKIKHVLISAFDDNSISLSVYHAGEKLAEYALSVDCGCPSLRAAENIGLINSVTDLRLDESASPYAECRKTADVLAKLSDESGLPLGLTFHDILLDPQKYDASYFTFDLFNDMDDFIPNGSVHVLNCGAETVGDKIAEAFNIKILPYAECERKVMFHSLAGRGVHNNGNYSFLCAVKDIIENEQGVKALSEQLKDNRILRCIHSRENAYSLSLFKGGKAVSELLIEFNGDEKHTAVYTDIEQLEKALNLDFKSLIDSIDPRDFQYYMENKLSEKLNLPLMFSYDDMSDFYDFCQPDQYVFDDEYCFDDEERGFDKKSYSSETLKLIRGLFGVDTA